MRRKAQVVGDMDPYFQDVMSFRFTFSMETVPFLENLWQV